MIPSVETLTRWIEKWLSTLVIVVTAALIGWTAYGLIGDTWSTVMECIGHTLQSDTLSSSGSTRLDTVRGGCSASTP